MAAKTTLSRDEKRTLLNHHVGKIRLALGVVENARTPFDDARTDLTAVIDQARADLGKKNYTRGYLLSLTSDTKAKIRDQGAEEVQRYQDRVDLNLPVAGDQLMLALDSDTTPQEAKDEIAWEAEGFAAGRRGDERKAPEGCPPRFVQASLRGWDQGQSTTQLLFVEAQTLMKKRAEPDATGDAKDLNAGAPAEPEAGSPEAKAAERKSVGLAKESLAKMGGAKKPGDEGFEASPEELAGQKGRQAVVDRREGATSGEPAPVH